MKRASWAASSHPGVRRPTNEDFYCGRPDLGLFVVADGMGGHVAGEVASRVAVEVIEAFTADTVGADETSTWPFPFDPSLSLDGNRIKSAIRMANRSIGTTAGSAEALRGMGTTVSVVLMPREPAVVAHVGDSRVYLLRGATLTRLTADHSWVEEQVRAGMLTASAARQHPWRNVVTRALGGGTDPTIDVAEVAFAPGDRVLLCSDGLSSVVGDDQIRDILRGAGPLDRLCHALVAAANGAGGPDNVTALVLEVDVS